MPSSIFQGPGFQKRTYDLKFSNHHYSTVRIASPQRAPAGPSVLREEPPALQRAGLAPLAPALQKPLSHTCTQTLLCVALVHAVAFKEYKGKQQFLPAKMSTCILSETFYLCDLK